MRNIIDSVVGFFDPEAGLKRTQARLANDLIMQRGYNAAAGGRRNDGFFTTNTSGAQEASRASGKLGEVGQELVRNNPLARRAKRVWANNVVGKGIQIDLTSSSKARARREMEAFNTWFESTDCDFEGHNTGYGLQWLWMTTVVESGGVFIRRHILPPSSRLEIKLQLQTLEQDNLDKGKNSRTETATIIDGIQYNGDGQIEGYWFFTEPTNTRLIGQRVSKFYRAELITHIYDKERAGTHLGISWFAATANDLNNYSTYMDAKLMQQQIAACFALIVENSDQNVGVGGGTPDLPTTIEPAMIEHVKQGAVPHVITPPKADNSSTFDVGLKRDMAAGLGLTYEQFTGDYSLVNFASGRMGKNEFGQELDHVQQHMMKPALDKVFRWFDLAYQLGGSQRQAVFKVNWTFPPRTSINPKEEFDVLVAKVRHGMMSPSKAAKLLGEKLEQVIEQWEQDKELFGDLPFDIDPSIYAATGNQLDNNDAASSNANSNDTGAVSTDSNSNEDN